MVGFDKLDRYRNLQGSQTETVVEDSASRLDRYRNLQGSQTNTETVR